MKKARSRTARTARPLKRSTMTEEGSRACKMSCGDVTLKITLTPKLLKKPFEEAVLAPFLKAYSKKVRGCKTRTARELAER